jgi:iron complex outermembrane recepter protein
LLTQVPGLIIGDLQGNQFQTDIQFRGFEASPVNGVAQGLAVYQNGVRINESFGDIINWDFLPTNAINNVAVVVGNPVFGLNALGGAVVVDMKDGFNFHGADVDTGFGSFGRKQVSTEAGYQSGNWAAYGAFEAINDDGFRDFSDAEVRRGYFDLGVKGDNAAFHFNFTGADNNVGVTAAAPEELLDISRSLTFTSPQTTENTMQMYSVNGTVRATKDITLSGVTYYRHFNQKHVDGNLFDDPGDCGDGTLCSGDNQVLNAANGQPIPFTDNVYGSIDKTSQNADGAGFTLQATNTAKLFDHKNQFVIGTSYDHGFVAYTADSELGFMEPKFVVAGQGVILSRTDDFNPRSLNTINDYYGIYFTDTLDITDQLSLTVGGRYNYARIQIENTGSPDNDELNGVNHYHRFNPSAGLTYAFSPELNWYGGYSEANRAPTAAELACADPENPCLIESFLTADPHLKQVVSHTWEAGFRGTIKNWGLGRWPLPHAQYRRYFRCSIDRYRPRLFPERRQYPSPRCRSEHRISHTQSVRVCQLHLHRCDIRQRLYIPVAQPSCELQPRSLRL